MFVFCWSRRRRCLRPSDRVTRGMYRFHCPMGLLCAMYPDGEEPALQLRGAASTLGPAGRGESTRHVPAVQGDGLVRGDSGRSDLLREGEKHLHREMETLRWVRTVPAI